jgi:cell division protein FtsW
MRLFARGRELSLLLPAVCLYAAGYTSLLIERDTPLSPRAYGAPLIFLGVTFGVHFWFCWIRFRGDEFMFPTVAMLLALSLLMVDRLQPSVWAKQVLWFVLGCAVMAGIVTWRGDVVWLARYKYTQAVTGLALVLVTAVFGHEINGARLWLRAGPLSFQTSEALKLMLVIFIAAYLDEKRELLALSTFRWRSLRLPPLAYLGPLLVMWALSLLSLVWQRDLGGTLLLLGVALAMIYVATGRRYYVFGGLLLFLANLALTYRLFPYVRNRIDIWLHPWQYAQDRSYQIVQALYAISSGGLLGSGLGEGYPRFIPEVHTDFIFAAIAEELGLLGAAAVMALSLVLIFRGLRTALHAPGDFERLLAVGFSSMLALQCLVIIGGNLSAIPLTGITLPFVSYGGSSLLVNFAIVGLLLKLSSRPEPALNPELRSLADGNENGPMRGHVRVP